MAAGAALRIQNSAVLPLLCTARYPDLARPRLKTPPAIRLIDRTLVLWLFLLSVGVSSFAWNMADKLAGLQQPHIRGRKTGSIFLQGSARFPGRFPNLLQVVGSTSPKKKIA